MFECNLHFTKGIRGEPGCFAKMCVVWRAVAVKVRNGEIKKNVVRLNTYQGNSHRTARGLRRFVGEKCVVGREWSIAHKDAFQHIYVSSTAFSVWSCSCEGKDSRKCQVYIFPVSLAMNLMYQFLLRSKVSSNNGAPWG